MPRPEQEPAPPVAGARLLKCGEGIAHPDVWLVEAPDGSTEVWKTWRRRPAWERRTLGRWFAQREARILRRLEGIEGVPRLVATPEEWTVAMSVLEGEPLPSRPDERLTPAFLDRLGRLLDALHQRRITHGDVRLRNVLRTREGEALPMLVDFTQSQSFRTESWLFRQARGVDRMKFLQLKERLAPQSLTESERRELQSPPWWFRLGHLLRDRVYRPIKHWSRGEGLRRRRSRKGA